MTKNYKSLNSCSINQIIELNEHPSRPNKKGEGVLQTLNQSLFLEEIFEHMQLFVDLLVSKMIFITKVVGVVIRQNRISKKLSLYNIFFIFAL